MIDNEPHSTSSRNPWKISFVVLLVVIVLAAVGSLYWFRLRTSTVIPVDIQKQLVFNVLLPSSDAYSVENISYDNQTAVLSFTLVGAEAKFIITQQATPDSFTEIPEYYDKLVESLLEYKRFDSDIGQVSLTKPKEFNGQQAAVLNTKGTLMFARPDTDLSDEAWRLFFKTVQVHN